MMLRVSTSACHGAVMAHFVPPKNRPGSAGIPEPRPAIPAADHIADNRNGAYASASASVGSSSLSPSSAQGDSSNASAPAHLVIPGDRVAYFFRDGYTCRLCGLLHGTPRQHFVEGVEARNHVMREILASCMADGERRGIPAARMRASWLTALQNCRTIALSLPAQDAVPLTPASPGQPPPTHAQLLDLLKRRALAAQRVVVALRDMEVLRSSLAPARRQLGNDKAETRRARNTAAFERREYVGDSMWGDQCSRRFFALFPFRDWLAPAHAWAWGMLRDGVEMNDNLTRLFDLMDLGAVLPPDVVLGGEKPKADILEAIMGDAWLLLAATEHPLVGAASAAGVVCPLAPAYPAGTATAAATTLGRWLLDEIVDLLTLCFLLHFASDAGIALAQDVTSKEHWARFAPTLRQTAEAPLSGRRLRRFLHGQPFTFRRLTLASAPSGGGSEWLSQSPPLPHASAVDPGAPLHMLSGSWARVVVDPSTNEHRAVYERDGALGGHSATAILAASVQRSMELTLPKAMQLPELNAPIAPAQEGIGPQTQAAPLLPPLRAAPLHPSASDGVHHTKFTDGVLCWTRRYLSGREPARDAPGSSIRNAALRTEAFQMVTQTPRQLSASPDVATLDDAWYGAAKRWGTLGEMQPPLQPAPPVDESRVHSAPFLINSGIIPQIVLDADARRQAAAALRKKKRR